MAGFDGTDLNDDLKYLIDTLKIGGIILFSRNIQNPDQIKKLCSDVQKYTISCAQPPLFIAIDQEGGVVARLKSPFTEFPGNPKMKGEEDAEYFAAVTASELNRTGINMNFAPVMDIAPPGFNSIMADRVFGDNPELVSRLGVKVIETLQNNGIMATAKHFPGIGRTVLDSHLELPVMNADMEDLASFDLVTFQAAIDHGVAAVMLSHICYSKIDPDLPASLSTRIAKELLREQMGFDGLVITDDLDMGAVKKHYNIQTAIPLILSADIDIILVCHKGPAIEDAFNEILKYLETDPRIRRSGEASVRRIMNLKKEYII